MVQSGFASRKNSTTYSVKIFNKGLEQPVSITSFIKKDDAVKAFVGTVSSALTLTPTIFKVLLIEERKDEYSYLAEFKMEIN
jgi:hypothetical protein